MSDLITVRGVGLPDRVALFEKNPAHPGGEVFVIVGETAVVGRTSAVNTLINQGGLRVVEGAEAKVEEAPEVNTGGDAEVGPEAQAPVKPKGGRPGRNSS